ncbi:MAG: MoxR family ATPase [Synergistetes bacterium]|nr:MoxR family ATPase [Synergistota bacterium]
MFTSPEDLRLRFAENKYIVDEGVATVVYIAIKLKKPLLVEGPAGVGKTDLARVLADATGSELIRLQCYEGIDSSKALYDWNYQKQLLRIYADQRERKSWEEVKQTIYSEEFLLPRPLLKAILSERQAVLLIDEIDKSDEEFEAFLLEFLSDYQVSIPEFGTVKAKSIPFVVLTSNNARDFGDALKRRCIHLYLDYPSFEREMEIIRLKVPGIREKLLKEIVCFIQRLRTLGLKKAPSIAEAIEWAQALLELKVDELTDEVVRSTSGIILKYKTDIERLNSIDVDSFISSVA